MRFISHLSTYFALFVATISQLLLPCPLSAQQKTTVAVIDGGFDTTHTFLKPYISQTPGWNFLGNTEGENITRTGTEDYRAWKRLRLRYLASESSLSEQEKELMDSLQRRIHIESYILYARNAEAIGQHFDVADSIMKAFYGDKATTLADFKKVEVEDTTDIMPALQTVVLRTMPYEDSTSWATIVDKFRGEAATAAARMQQINADDDAHRRIGNTPDDVQHLSGYGNSNINISADDSYHGTMVMGLVAQVAQKCKADIQIIPIRAIPDGDEYDRDVASALKYAIDNGAMVINMSFGKTFSPYRHVVDSLLDVAAQRDILLVKASGNNSANSDSIVYYPSPIALDGHHRDNIIVVGAAGTDGNIMRLSNYGPLTVDVLAPGENVKSTAPGDEWSTNQGTSLAAPQVAGLAAAIRSLYPHLSAPQVRTIIMQSASPAPTATSSLPSSVPDVATVSQPLHATAAGLINIQKALDLAAKTKPFSTDTLSRHILNNYVDVTWLDEDDSQFFFKKKQRKADGTIEPIYLLGNTRTRRIQPVDSVMHAPEKPSSFRQSSEPYWKRFSADSLFYIYAYDDDLYLAHKEPSTSDPQTLTPAPLRLTSDGEHFNSYAVGGNTMRGTKGYSSAEGKWIGNTHRFIVLREDKRDVPTLTYVDNLAQPRPRAVTIKYSMPGDTAVSHFAAYIVNADKGSVEQLDFEAYPDQIIETPRFRGITTSGHYAYLLRKSRAQDEVDLLRIDASDNSVRVIIHEECKPHLNEQLFNYHVLNNGEDILWWAERGDRGQWFHYDGNGKLKHTITPADMVAAEIEHIDTLARTLIFKGYGHEPEASNPCYAYYYRVGFNGRGLTLLTPGNGNHSIKLSPMGRYLVDHFSRVDFAGQYNLRDLKGNLVCELATADVSALTAKGWRTPQQMQITAADGQTPLYGVVYTPYNMRPTDKLPIISNPYPGPHTDLLPLDFSLDDDGNQALADEGFVVISFSYRGCNPWRGRQFYTHGYGNLRDYALDDDYAAIRQVAARIPQADTTRVGIYGHSGGAFLSTTALLSRPEFYKVAVAASGNHDNNIYLKWWGETFHGIHQRTDSLGHTHWEAHIPTNMELAGNLKGHLLLIHGDVDNNVHPASTLRMAQALIRAGKLFDMLMLPGVDHGVGDQYYQTTVRAYFREHLLGKPTPVELMQELGN
ncbi:MAG: prolyl oligopeptidase family serine peptidase [Bacteroidaceae bacterium]|nr:prolyl oligopeptidase family serine peptidase [Bacteroidaceae bacterium]